MDFNQNCFIFFFLLRKSDFPKVQKLFPNSELKYVKGAGHWVHSQKPNEFLELVLDFLKTDSSS